MLKYLLLSSTVAVSLFSASCFGCIHNASAASSSADDTSNGLSEKLLSLILDLTSRAPGVSPTYAISNGFILLPKGIPLQNEAARGSLSKTIRGVVDKIPGPPLSQAPERSARKTLLQLVGNVEFSTLKLSSDQLAELSSAQNMLFEGDGKTPSSEYKRYLRYKEQYDKVVASLATETNEAAKLSLQSELQQINSDWTVLGRRGEIDQALNSIMRLSEGSAEQSYTAWVEKLKADDSSVEDKIIGSLAAGNWLKVSASGEDNPDVSLFAGKSYTLPPLARISFDFVLLDVHDPILDDDFLQDRTWRTKSGKVLSDGNAAADDALELMPRVTVGLIVVRNIVLSFKEDASSNGLSAIGSSQDVTLGRIPIKCQGCGAPSFHVRTIAAPTPVVIAIVASDLAKIPNPDPDRTWLTK